MFVRNKAQAPVRVRDAWKTHILMEMGDVENTDLTVTWVDVEPGQGMKTHSHAPEQVFVVVSGCGRPEVGDESHDIGPGDLGRAPSDVPHRVVNSGDAVLSYISIATPAFKQTEFYDEGNI